MSDLIALLRWFADLAHGRRHVRVLVHRAFFQPGPPWYYFVKVTNLSQKRAIVITHIWFETKPPKHVLDNGLPARLPPDEIFETCVPVAEVPDVAHVERLVRVLLSSGKIVKSRLNKDVPPVGYVARPGSPHGGHGLAQQEPLPVSSTYRILDSSSSTDSSTSAFSSTELLDERLAHRGRAGDDAEVDT